MRRCVQVLIVRMGLSRNSYSGAKPVKDKTHTAQRELQLKQVSLLRLISTAIDIQDERIEIRRMKTQMKLIYSCLTVTTTTKSTHVCLPG